MKNKSLINLIILLFLIIAVVVVMRNQKSNSTDAFRKNQSSHFVNTRIKAAFEELGNSPAKLALRVDRPAPPLTWANPIIFVIVIYSF